MDTHGLLGRWMRWVTAGEALGFVTPAVVGVLFFDAPAVVALPVFVLAGLVEGTVLGLFQARVLRDVLDVDARRWVVATALGAGAAWLIGMLPSTTWPLWEDWSGAVVLPLVAVLGSVLLVSIGVAQWTVLRRHLRRAGWWVAATALAWALGLGAFSAVSAPLWQPGQPTLLVAAIGVLAGVVMAATMALVTGLALRRLLRRQGPVVALVTALPQTAPGKPSWRQAS